MNEKISDALKEIQKPELTLRQALSTMKCGERIYQGDTNFLAVPGGWVCTTYSDQGIASCFVPDFSPRVHV